MPYKLVKKDSTTKKGIAGKLVKKPVPQKKSRGMFRKDIKRMA
jgi:hypothetical protein